MTSVIYNPKAHRMLQLVSQPLLLSLCHFPCSLKSDCLMRKRQASRPPCPRGSEALRGPGVQRPQHDAKLPHRGGQPSSQWPLPFRRECFDMLQTLPCIYGSLDLGCYHLFCTFWEDSIIFHNSDHLNLPHKGSELFSLRKDFSPNVLS